MFTAIGRKYQQVRVSAGPSLFDALMPDWAERWRVLAESVARCGSGGEPSAILGEWQFW
jgi:hypothetical protein